MVSKCSVVTSLPVRHHYIKYENGNILAQKYVLFMDIYMFFTNIKLNLTASEIAAYQDVYHRTSGHQADIGRRQSVQNGRGYWMAHQVSTDCQTNNICSLF